MHGQCYGGNHECLPMFLARIATVSFVGISSLLLHPEPVCSNVNYCAGIGRHLSDEIAEGKSVPGSGPYTTNWYIRQWVHNDCETKTGKSPFSFMDPKPSKPLTAEEIQVKKLSDKDFGSTKGERRKIAPTSWWSTDLKDVFNDQQHSRLPPIT